MSLDFENADKLAEVLRAVAHPIRLRILSILCESDANVTELVGLTGASQSLVSQHLFKMRTLGLVSVERRGSWATYSLAMPRLRSLLTCLSGCDVGKAGGTE